VDWHFFNTGPPKHCGLKVREHDQTIDCTSPRFHPAMSFDAYGNSRRSRPGLFVASVNHGRDGVALIHTYLAYLPISQK
jgi:hypothetical protein